MGGFDQVTVTPSQCTHPESYMCGNVLVKYHYVYHEDHKACFFVIEHCFLLLPGLSERTRSPSLAQFPMPVPSSTPAGLFFEPFPAEFRQPDAVRPALASIDAVTPVSFMFSPARNLQNTRDMPANKRCRRLTSTFQKGRQRSCILFSSSLLFCLCFLKRYPRRPTITACLSRHLVCH